MFDFIRRAGDAARQADPSRRIPLADARGVSDRPLAGGEQTFLQLCLEILGELVALLRDVKDVDGAIAFGIDQHDVDVAGGRRKHGGQTVEQSRRSSALISTSVAVSQASESKPTLGGTPWRLVSVGGRLRNKRWTSVLPVATRRIRSCKRSASLGFNSSVRLGSAKTNVSRIMPLVLENASAFRISRPKLDRAPASEANKNGISRATTVSR